jgi:adenylyltransferase/sulfurtransferase
VSRLDISPEDLYALLNSSRNVPLLLDVRRYDERELACIGGCDHIPLDELADRLDELDQSAEYVAYCHHGIRSLSAAAILEAAGFPSPRSLRGGIDAWSIRIAPDVPRY